MKTRILQKLLFISIIFISAENFCYAQNIIEHQKKTYTDSLNTFYTQTSLPLYFFVSTKPDDTKPTPLNKQNGSPEKQAVILENNGKHQIKIYNPISNLIETFTINADGTTPKSSPVFKETKSYAINNSIFYGKNLKLEISANDDMSGIQQIYYSINNKEYQKFNSDLQNFSDGQYSLKYYTVDNVGNTEKENIQIFTVDNTDPQTICEISDILDSTVISENGKIIINARDNSSGIKNTYYKIDKQEYQILKTNSIYFQNLNEGSHTIYFYSTDNVSNTEQEQKQEFFLDKTAPIIATDILGDRFVIQDKIFFSGRTKLKLTAIDNKAGVKEVMYSIDKEEFKKYSEAFYLPSSKGMHIVNYYAIDKLGNRTKSKTNNGLLQYEHFVGKIYVDLTGPDLYHKFTGKQFISKDTLYISKDTKIEFRQTDPESGPDKITYTIDDENTETQYNAPFTIQKPGFHTIDQIGYDKVNNRNYKTLKFVVDATAPKIYHQFSAKELQNTDSLQTYPYYSSIFIAPQDDLSGIETILYSINNGPVKSYYRKISGFAKNKINKVKITVTDKLGNTSEKEIIFIAQ